MKIVADCSRCRRKVCIHCNTTQKHRGGVTTKRQTTTRRSRR